MLTTHLLLVPRLRKGWDIPPHTLWVLLGLLRGSLYLFLYSCSVTFFPHIQHFNCNYFINVETIRKIINLYLILLKFPANLNVTYKLKSWLTFYFAVILLSGKSSSIIHDIHFWQNWNRSDYIYVDVPTAEKFLNLVLRLQGESVYLVIALIFVNMQDNYCTTHLMLYYNDK
jgi:hypothetical protein